MFQHPLDPEHHISLIQKHHSAALFQAVDENRSHLRPFLPWVDLTRSKADTNAFIERSLQQFANGTGLHAAIWRGLKVVGVVGFNSIMQVNRCGTIGYWLTQEAQGQGLMTRACQALITHGFADLELHRIVIRCAPQNTSSRAIPERLGFTQEGSLREVEWLHGQYVDNVVYSMLESEWGDKRSDA